MHWTIDGGDNHMGSEHKVQTSTQNRQYDVQKEFDGGRRQICSRLYCWPGNLCDAWHSSRRSLPELHIACGCEVYFCKVALSHFQQRLLREGRLDSSTNDNRAPRHYQHRREAFRWTLLTVNTVGHRVGRRISWLPWPLIASAESSLSVYEMYDSWHNAIIERTKTLWTLNMYSVLKQIGTYFTGSSITHHTVCREAAVFVVPTKHKAETKRSSLPFSYPFDKIYNDIFIMNCLGTTSAIICHLYTKKNNSSPTHRSSGCR